MHQTFQILEFEYIWTKSSSQFLSTSKAVKNPAYGIKSTKEIKPQD